MKAALLIAVALAALAPAAVMAQNNITLCYVEVPVGPVGVTATGKLQVNTDSPISFKSAKNAADGEATFVVAWKPISGTGNDTVCSTTVDKKDTDLVAAWASARIVGYGFSPLKSGVITGAKTTGGAAKRYDFSIAGLEYEMGSGALSAKVNQQKPILLNYAVGYRDGGVLAGYFGGSNVTVDLKWVQIKAPLKGCKLQLSSKTSEVIVKCSTLRLNQLPKSQGEVTGTADGDGISTLTNFKVTFAKSQGAVDFASAKVATLPDVPPPAGR